MKVVAWCFTWLPLSAWCYWRMLHLSNHVVKLIGYDGMSADQCDVRQSILRGRGQYDEARKCIHSAFTKNAEAHTRGLLHIGLAEIYWHEGDLYDAEMEVHAALAEAREAEKQDPWQATRIYRHCADITDLIKHNPILGNKLRDKAKELAQTTGARDQLLKL